MIFGGIYGFFCSRFSLYFARTEWHFSATTRNLRIFRNVDWATLQTTPFSGDNIAVELTSPQGVCGVLTLRRTFGCLLLMAWKNISKLGRPKWVFPLSPLNRLVPDMFWKCSSQMYCNTIRYILFMPFGNWYFVTHNVNIKDWNGKCELYVIHDIEPRYQRGTL